MVVPVTAGATVFAGGPLTIALAADSAEDEPAEFVAVTFTRIVEPTSAWTRVYVVPVAPPMLLQFAPPWSHRSHCWANVGAGNPSHVPFAAVSTEPAAAVPLIVGRALLVGEPVT